MRRKIYPLLLAATMSLTACTEVLEPNIDYGGNTYINDYTALVKAVNDLQKSLEERFDALNTLLQNGMAEIKLSIDANTGAIQILTSTTQSGLDKINTSLFNGFDALNTQIKSTGDAIIFAMNENGELLRLKIDENGKLLETTLLANNAALIKCINDNSKTLDERFAALTAAVKAGFTDVTASVDKNTGAITLLDKNTNTSLDKINTSLVNGFKAINEHLDSNGNSVIEALNKNNELLTLTISKNGELIEAAIKGQTTAIVAAINDQTKALDERIKALNELITSGLKDIKLEINANTGAISLLDKNTNTSLGKINQNLLDGFANLNTKLVNIDQTLTGLSGNVAKVETAINTQGELIVSKLDKNNNILETEVIGSLNSIATKIGDQTTTMSEKIKALNDLINSGLIKMDTTNDKLGTIGANLGTLNTKVDEVNGNLSTINGSIGSVKSELNSMNDKLSTIAQNISEGFTTINKKLGTDGTTIVEAINKNGEKLTTIFGTNGEKLSAISTALGTLNNSLTDEYTGLPAIISAHNALKEAISGENGLTAQEKQNAQNIINMLEKMMVADGIYTDNGNIYMDLATWTQVSQLGTSSATYQEIMNALPTSTPSIDWSWKLDNGNSHTHTGASVKQISYSGNKLIACNYGTKSNIGTTKSVYQIKKTPTQIYYKIDLADCAYKYIYQYEVTDAQFHTTFAGNWTTSVSFNLSTPYYNYSQGKTYETVKIIVYSKDKK